MTDLLKRYGANAAAIISILGLCAYVGITSPWYARADGLKLAGDVERIMRNQETLSLAIIQNQHDSCLQDLWRLQDQARSEPNSAFAADQVRRQEASCARIKQRLDMQMRAATN